jgi:hypothetical protein
MARIIKTGMTPAKKRRAHIRSCAEVIRLLAERTGFDDESRDMLAFLVFNLRDIYRTIDESAQAWDDRNYWKKSEALREKWRWTRTASEELKELVLEEKWQLIPPLLISLIPYFSDVNIQTITRGPDWWCGARRALVRENRQTSKV